MWPFTEHWFEATLDSDGLEIFYRVCGDTGFILSNICEYIYEYTYTMHNEKQNGLKGRFPFGPFGLKA